MKLSPKPIERPRTAAGPRRARRRLSDTILAAFHLACDQRDIDVASELLQVLEFMAKSRRNLPTGKERRTQESLVAAHERLWEIRHLARLIVPPMESNGEWRLDD